MGATYCVSMRRSGTDLMYGLVAGGQGTRGWEGYGPAAGIKTKTGVPDTAPAMGADVVCAMFPCSHEFETGLVGRPRRRKSRPRSTEGLSPRPPLKSGPKHPHILYLHPEHMFAHKDVTGVRSRVANHRSIVICGILPKNHRSARKEILLPQCSCMPGGLGSPPACTRRSQRPRRPVGSGSAFIGPLTP